MSRSNWLHEHATRLNGPRENTVRGDAKQRKCGVVKVCPLSGKASCVVPLVGKHAFVRLIFLFKLLGRVG